MTINKKDLRYKKTDTKIRETFLALLKSEGYQKITISKIIKVAHINRSTFYDHYIDKEDLIEKIEVHLILQLIDNLPELNMHALNNVEVINLRIRMLIERIYANKQIIYLFFSDQSDALFMNRLMKFSKNFLLETDIIQNLKIPTIYAYSIIESVFMNLVKNWVLNDFKESSDEFAEIVSKIIPKLYLDLIN